MARNWARITGLVILALEIIWALYWFITMIWLQVSTDDTSHGFDYRFSHIIVALHGLSAIALIGALWEKHDYSVVVAWFFVFSAMTDTWSLLDTALHLSRDENYHAWRVEMGVTSWAFALSVISLVWYLVAVICCKGNPSGHVVRGHGSEAGTPLLPPQGGAMGHALPVRASLYEYKSV